jgi:uncharacterized Zn finger protein
MPSIPRIKKSDISCWTDEAYFQRGLKYYEKGTIYDQQRQGIGSSKKYMSERRNSAHFRMN